MAYSHFANHYQITYDNHKEDEVLLHKNENRIIKFVRSKWGMFYHNLINFQVTPMNTSKENEVNHIKHQLDQKK